tara:strand:- start:27 stop:350 length:324 start_codon:yes stop_codon:yes gene_type:complete
MTYNAKPNARIVGPGLRKPGVSRQLAAGAASANTALTASCERISICATGADIRYAIGTSAQTANAGTSHFIKQNERIELDIDFNSQIAFIRDASADGVAEVTEFVNY